MMVRLTVLRLMVAFSVATACEWVRPSRLFSLTFINKSPFCKEKEVNIIIARDDGYSDGISEEEMKSNLTSEAGLIFNPVD